MLQQGLCQALKQPMISGSKTTKGFLSPSCLFLHVFFLPHYSWSLRSVSHSFSSANAPRLLPSFNSRSCGDFHLQCRVRSQAQSGKLAACLPGFCLLWVLAMVAVISTEPNSCPLASFSFNKASLKLPKPPSASSNSWVENSSPSFFHLFAQIYFLRALFTQCFLLRVAQMEPWFTSTLYELMLFHMFNSVKHQTNFFFYLCSLEEIVFLFFLTGRLITFLVC